MDERQKRAKPRRDMKPATTLVHSGRPKPVEGGKTVNPGIFRASTVLFDDLASWQESEQHRFEQNYLQYGRLGTPTHFALTEALAALEGAHDGVVLPSGLAAVALSMLSQVAAGDHILVADTVYAPTRAFCRHTLARFGVETTFYDPLIGAGIAALFRPNSKLVFLESPGSLTFEVQDLPAIAAAARPAGLKVVIDNTWATPLYFQPFRHGADLVVHAATKYITGHADAMLGVVLCQEADFAPLRREATLLGYISGADDAYLALRGLRSLAARMARHQDNGLALAGWLRDRPEVTRVMHPGLPDDPGHALWRRDFQGASGLFGFEIAPVPEAAVRAFIDGLAYFGLGASWGGFESLLIPTYPAQIRTAVPWREAGPTFRVHAGLEDLQDLIADLDAAFERLNRTAAD
jgi:cystathionine beta-lyase